MSGTFITGNCIPLEDLVEKGLVDKGQLDRRTNFYRLTRRGQHAITARFDWEGQDVETDTETPGR